MDRVNAITISTEPSLIRAFASMRKSLSDTFGQILNDTWTLTDCEFYQDEYTESDLDEWIAHIETDMR